MDKNRQPSSYPRVRRVDIGFDMLTLGSSSDMLALWSRRWVSRCWGCFETFRWFQDVDIGWFRDVGTKFETLGLISKCWRWSQLGFEMLALRSRHHNWVQDIDTGIETSRLVDTGLSLVNGNGKGKEGRCGCTL